tara:strand:+ start:1297 stop:2373 length:1077 start_codon:yes stop_codon:yes gene_type:complete
MANRKLVELLIEEGQDAFGVEAISLVKFPAIEENFIFFSKDKKQKALSLAAIDEDKRTLIGAALIPDKNIPRYDELSDEEYDVFFSQDTVKLASELFLKSNRTNEHTFEHEEKVDGVSVVESWIVEDPDMDKSKHYGMSMPVGTWMVRVHVGNDEMWEAVKEGSIRGFSIEGYFVDSVQEMSTKVKRASMSNIVKKLWGFFKRKFYAEVNLQNGGVIATDDEALTAGSAVFTLDDEGLPVEIDNGKYKTEAGVDLEVFEGVLIEYDGEVQAVEDKVEEEVEMEKVELDQMKVKYYKALLKGRFKKMFGSYENFNNLEEEYIELESYAWDDCIADQMKRYGNKETAEKVCGSIKAKYGN